uniref:Uncharacterized protein n=1 Tax=Panagrolaimus sp. ES5 TaxID=591445 RepID=A0AC34F5P9_9BILA
MGNICNNSKISVTENVVEEKNNSTPAAPVAPPSIQPRPATALPDDDGEGILRLLLLGAAESGKTTLLEQIRMLHKQNFTEYELIHRRAFIYNNIMHSMKAIILNAQKNQYSLLTENEFRAKTIINNADECLGRLTEEEYDAIINLWQDPGIQEAYTHRGEYNLNDSAKYFFDAMERINKPDFHPTPSDLIRAYVPTIGIQNIVFNAKKRTFQLLDIGGQKVDRRKWATMYDGIDAIFFCSAISEYDQSFEDDDDQSRLMDSLELLEQICNEPKFQNTPIFIFLNETDVLKEKLLTFPLENHFPEYTGNTEAEALEFLKAKVKERCTNHPNNLFIEFICAVENETMAKILDKVFKKLLQLVK